ncbi:DinB family protein [Thalassobacillus hwangdonensis]|uniref:DinB family protein n=1 Tax=Thalassobacillus hwangdonensis TaxID=546108 RepID=A0ABW3L6X5_9BACI
MNFKMSEAIEILEQTPKTLAQLLSGLSEGWVTCNEGEETWNAAEVVAHLIEGEKNNWIPRLEFILREGKTAPFPAFDRFSHLNGTYQNSLEERLEEFNMIRKTNVQKLKELMKSDEQLELEGYHPLLGEVKVKNLIATWAVHDLTHIAQVTRVLAKRYQEDVGPYKQFLGVLN